MAAAAGKAAGVAAVVAGEVAAAEAVMAAAVAAAMTAMAAVPAAVLDIRSSTMSLTTLILCQIVLKYMFQGFLACFLP